VCDNADAEVLQLIADAIAVAVSRSFTAGAEASNASFLRRSGLPHRELRLGVLQAPDARADSQLMDGEAWLCMVLSALLPFR